MSFAASPTPATNDIHSISDICTAWIDDKDGSVNYDGLQKQDWLPCKEVKLNQGYSRKTLWFTFDIENSTSEDNSLYVYFPISWLNDIQFFQDDRFIKAASASFQSFSQRDFPTSGFSFPFVVEANSVTNLTFRVKSQDALIANSFIVNQESIQLLNNRTQLFNGILIGGMLLLAIYNFSLFVLVRDKNYFYYVAYSLSVLLLCGTIYGFNFQYFWPNLPSFNLSSNAATSGLTYFTLIVFVRHFLSTQQFLPRLDKLLFALLILAALQFIGSFTPIPHFYMVTMAGSFALIGTPIVLLAGFYAWLKKVPSSKFFLLAYGVSLGATTLFGALFYGFFDFNYIMYSVFGIGMLLEVVLLSFALADKIKILLNEKTQAQARAIEAQKQLVVGLTKAKDQLEHEVDRRTEELNVEKLRAETLALTDELTQLNNRRAFFKFGNNLHSDAARSERPYAVIMLDIDHFKKINDTYGHATGDEAITAVANCLIQASRTSDVAARIGGEEFALVLPYTNINKAKPLAERIRQELKKLVIPADDTDVTLTASFGISQWKQGDEDLEAVLARADLALYEAKQSGRDKVITSVTV